jgi:hypothetical protein
MQGFQRFELSSETHCIASQALKNDTRHETHETNRRLA